MISDFDKLCEAMRDKGCTRLLIKPLAPNDNSKNQPYVAKERSLIGFNVLPASAFRAEGRNFHADLDFAWLDDDGACWPAPRAKLIHATLGGPMGGDKRDTGQVCSQLNRERTWTYDSSPGVVRAVCAAHWLGPSPAQRTPV